MSLNWNKNLIIIITTFLLGACQTPGKMTMKDNFYIDTTIVSPNQDNRIRFLILHYTTANDADSILDLTDKYGRQVSSHYLVPLDLQYKNSKPIILQLVPEEKRAWHAGVSRWGNRSNINDTSIGVEIVNLASEHNNVFNFPAFPANQINAVIALAQDILQRNPDITPTQVIGHSDLTTDGRKSDPGASFPWEQLYKAGVGAWYDEPVKQHYMTQFSQTMPEKDQLIERIARYGYDTSGANTEEGYMLLTRTIQLHFRQSNYDGHMDAETAAVIYALTDKYFPKI